MAKPKLLFLSQSLPYPPDGGVEIRTYNILRLLSRAFDVTALCFYRAAVRRTAEEVERSRTALERIARVQVYPIPQEHSRSRLVRDHVRSVLSGRVYTRYVYDSREFMESVTAHLRGSDFQLVHVDSLDLSSALPRLTGIRLVCTHHNVESQLLRRRALRASSTAIATYLRLQANLMEREERIQCPRFALNVAVSTADAEELSAIAPEARFAVVPNGVDTETFRPSDGPQEGLVFVGGYNWAPNREAMEYFATRILPTIRARRRDVSMTWVGRAPEEARASYAARGIHMTGYVDDVAPHIGRAACYVVPLETGGGTRLKILEAWAMGKAIVSTSQGCEGLAVEDGVNVLIRDKPESFAEAVLQVLNDRALRARLGAAGRAVARETYDWEVIGARLIRCYRSLLDPRDQTTSGQAPSSASS